MLESSESVISKIELILICTLFYLQFLMKTFISYHQSEEIIVDHANELGEHEVIIESERAPTPEEILPDVAKKPTSVPPLRPLTIAPKPTAVATRPAVQLKTSGQQLLLLQGGQTIKLIGTAAAATQEVGRSVITQPKQVLMKRVIAPANKTAIPRTAVVGKQQVSLSINCHLFIIDGLSSTWFSKSK